ncbi:hypothetical protein [Mycolicibacterium vaccae]|uniref:hypothetical protein n=1 Tax=Mycolicibacterium vaccae TaxID=1810 RepID=UPI0002D5725F|nr:monooxygenase [Mycolicibacterium vaccae 95051]
MGPRQQRAYAGKHYQLQETLCSPQPIHRLNVLIGGGGERKTLRLVAQYGDACNLFATSPDDVAHKLGVLRRHCDDLGRDYETIRRTVTVHDPQPTKDTRDEFVRAMSNTQSWASTPRSSCRATVLRRSGSTASPRRSSIWPNSDACARAAASP